MAHDLFLEKEMPDISWEKDEEVRANQAKILIFSLSNTDVV